MTRTQFQPGPAEDHYHETLGVGELPSDMGHGFSVYWYNASGWTLPNDGGWRTSDYPPTGVYWDTDGYQNPGGLPYFAAIVPASAGGLYYGDLKVVYKSAISGGFVGALIGGSDVYTEWAPCVFADLTKTQVLMCVTTRLLTDGDNGWDFASFVNLSGHDVTVTRVDFKVARLSAIPATPA